MTWHNSGLWSFGLFLFLLLLVVIVSSHGQRLRRLRSLDRVTTGTGNAWTHLNRPLVILRLMLLLAASSGMTIAFLGPQWGYKELETRSKGLDIVMVVDVSRSMDAIDVSPSRILKVKQFIKDFLGEAKEDRIGLVAFAGSSFVQCPLTNDFEALKLFLDVLNTNLIPYQGSDLEGAIKTAVKSLKGVSPSAPEAPSDSQFLLLMSDGEFEDQDIKTAIKPALDGHVPILGLGFGTFSGGPIPERDGSYKKKSNGEVVITKLVESSLQSMTQETGGMYWSAASIGYNAHVVYQDGVVARGQDKEQAIRKGRIYNEMYQWPLSVALIALLLEWLLSDRRGRRLSHLGLLVSMVLWSFIDKPLFADEISDFKKYEELARQGKIEEAEKGFEALSKSQDPNMSMRSFYNLGTAKAMRQDFKGASESYKKALGLDPQDQMTKKNLEWVEKKLDQQKDQNQQQKDQQQKDQQQKDQQQKDQQQKDQQQQQQQKDQNQQLKDQSEQKQGDESAKDNKPAAAKDEQKAEKDKEKMSREEAERLMRMVPDDLGKFYRVPENMENQRAKTKDHGQDW
jgi:Ca-activated chloride channel homolog